MEEGSEEGSVGGFRSEDVDPPGVGKQEFINDPQRGQFRVT